MGSKKAFVIDGTGNLRKGVAFIENKNVNADGFADYKSLLYKLHKKKKCGYDYGCIRENDNKYTLQVVKNFINKIDPNIQIILFKNTEDLYRKIDRLLLTN